MITAPTSLYVGEDLQLYAESSSDVSWSVCNTDGSPTELAEIDKNGLLTAKGAGYVLVYAAGASCLSGVYLHIRERASKPDIGYVLNGAVIDSVFNNVPPQLQIINSESVTGIYDIDNSLYVENPSQTIRDMAKDSGSDYAVVEVSKLDSKQQQTLIDELVGQVVEFYASEGLIPTIALASNDIAYADEALCLEGFGRNCEYFSESKRINFAGVEADTIAGKGVVTSDAVVFYIGSEGDNCEYKKSVGGASDSCTADMRGTLKDLSGATICGYSYNSDFDINIVVVYNTEHESLSRTGYGYVLNGNNTLKTIDVYDENGDIRKYKFCDEITVEGATDAIKKIAASADGSSAVLKPAEIDIGVLVSETAGRIVEISTDESGKIKSMKLAAENSADNTFALAIAGKTASYNAAAGELSADGVSLKVDADTKVLFVGDHTTSFAYAEPIYYNDLSVISITSGDKITDKTGVTAAAYSLAGDAARADILVLYNCDNIIRKDSALAFITEVTESAGGETRVKYIKNSAAGEAVLGSGVTGLSAETAQGSVYKLEITDGTITAAEPYLTFKNTLRDKLKAGDDVQLNGLPNVDVLKQADSVDEEIYFGAVLDKRENGRLTIAPMSGGKVDLNDMMYIFCSKQAGCCMYNAETGELRNANMGEIIIDRTLTAGGGMDDPRSISIEFADGTATGVTPAYGMLNFAFIRVSEGTAEVFIYTPWEYNNVEIMS